MRVAIFGDVHANLEALTAVLEDARERRATHFVCLGDIVGYNANPHECVEMIRKLDCPVVKGNHDAMAVGDGEVIGFNRCAKEAICWTRRHLLPADKQWLGELALVRQVQDFTMVHATLNTPHKWGYVFNQLDAAASFPYQETQVCFHGHTHSPRAFIRDPSVRSVCFDKLSIEPGKKYFVNVGSVGQPRDGDWRAAYALYTPEDRTAELRRVEYDLPKAREKALAAGLPWR